MSDEQESLPNLSEFPEMVAWYGPTALYATGLRTLISGVFGQYADQRVLQWATDQAPDEVLARRYDYSGLSTADGAVWVDYVADSGDGFDSCYAIASLVAAEHLDIESAGRLEGGQFLIAGGDQVYPYASIEQYDRRFVQPYRLADCDTKEPDRKLFVLPGNHDWYDGLAAFDHIFCQARDGVSNGLTIGRWQCPQHRSYFAIKLPHDWWIWGLDTQLTRNLDVGQIRYFRAVANSIPDRSKAKIILCLPEPVWHDAAKNAESAAKTSIPTNLDRLVPIAFEEAKVCAILSGDLHNYSRYHGVESGLNLITSGGGGAYLAPTHQMPDTLQVPWQGKTHEFSLRQDVPNPTGGKPKRAAPALFPSRGESRALSWRLLLFPFFNRAFAVAGIGLLYWFITWLYLSAQVDGSSYNCAGLEGVSELLRNADKCKVSGIQSRIWLMLDATNSVGPMLAFAVLGFFAALFLYVRSSSWMVRAIAATVHGVAHIAAMSELATFFTRFNHSPEVLGWIKMLRTNMPDSFAAALPFPFEMFLIGGMLGGMIWGIYLFLSCRVFYLHLDDAFSSLRIRQYKQFLRMRIEPDKLTIYPIGLRRVPIRMGWRKRTDEDKGVRAAFVARLGLKPHLIEGPIEIRPAEIKDF